MMIVALLLALAQDEFPKVGAADAKALEKLNQAGAVAIPLAANTNVVSVNFSMAGPKVSDASLEDLKPVAEQLVWLNLAGTGVTDAGLKAVGGFKNLQRLHLERTSIGDDDLSLGTLLLIGGALLAGFAVMGWFIMRDARRSLPEAERVGPRLREEGPHKRPKHAKERARAKTRAQKQARKAHRKR